MIRVFHSLPEAHAALGNTAITIGKYDGMHLGHQAILQQLKQVAARLGIPAVVILSEPQPEEFFAGAAAPVRLNAFHDKVRFLDQFGIDAVYCLNFDAQLSQLSANSFVDQMLLAGLGMKAIVVGEDFRFGFKRQGSVELLSELAPLRGFELRAVPPCVSANERISSTLIREFLDRGDCARVSECLGRPYSVSGRVVKGRQLGRELGFPTANIELQRNRLPLSGIFAVTVEEGNVVRQGVASIGYNPTVDSGNSLKLEVYLFDFVGDLYDKVLNVSFLEKLRDEQRFDDLTTLKKQIERDVAHAKAILGRAA